MERNLPTSVVEYEPASDGPEGEEKLSQDRDEDRGEDDGRDSSLDERTGWDDTEREDAKDDEDDVLHIVQGPTVCTKGAESVGGRDGGLEGGETGGRRLSTSDL